MQQGRGRTYLLRSHHIRDGGRGARGLRRTPLEPLGDGEQVAARVLLGEPPVAGHGACVMELLLLRSSRPALTPLCHREGRAHVARLLRGRAQQQLELFHAPLTSLERRPERAALGGRRAGGGPSLRFPQGRCTTP